jgi:adenylylsulfate kinase
VVVDYLVKNGISVVLTQVAPYNEMREKMREQFKDHYIEIYVKCSYEECARRDVKGYYKKHQQGEMKNFNGADDVFEIPKNSDIVIDTESETVDDAVDKILDYLEVKGYDI